MHKIGDIVRVIDAPTVPSKYVGQTGRIDKGTSGMFDWAVMLGGNKSHTYFYDKELSGICMFEEVDE